MKKKICVLSALFALIFALAACSDTQNAYLEKVSKMSDWKGITSEGTFDVKMSLNNEPASVNISAKGDIKGLMVNDKANPKGELTASIDVTSSQGNESMSFNLKDEKIYFSNSQIFLPISIYKKQFESLGVKDFPKDKKYVSLGAVTGKASGYDAEKIGAIVKNLSYVKDPKKMLEVYGKLGDLLGIEINMTEKNGVYTTVVNGADLMKMTEKMVKTLPDKLPEAVKLLELEALFETMPEKKELSSIIKNGMKKEYKEAIIAEYNKAKPELEKFLKDFSLKIEEKFSDDSYEAKAEISAKYDPLFSFSMVSSGKQMKSEPKEIKLPEAKDAVPLEELLSKLRTEIPYKSAAMIKEKENMVYGSKKVEPIKITKKNGVIHYEARKIFEALGGTVGWDAKKKVVTVDIDGKHYEVKPVNDNIVSYVTLDMLKNMGLNADRFEKEEMVSIWVAQ